MKVIKFAPGLIPVLKHGSHDQKTHGNWANSWATGARTTPDDKWLIDNFGDKTTFTRNDPNGLLRFSIPNSLIDDPRYQGTIQLSLDTLEKLQDSYPLTTQVDFVEGGKTQGGFLGETFSASVDGVPAPSKIILTEDLLKPNAEKDLLVHTIVHEWGHAQDWRTPEKAKEQGARFSQAKFEDDGIPMTDYGWYSDREAYAEAFAVKFNGAHKGGVWSANVEQTDKWEEVFKIFELDSVKKAKGERVSFLVKDTFDVNNPPVLIENYAPPVLKHQEHDQSSHGSWAGGSVSFKQDKNSLTMQDESGKTLASVDFVNLGNNRLDVNSIDSFDEGKGYATKVLEKLYSLFPKHSIFWGKTIVPASTHLAQKFSDKYGRTEFIPWGEGVIDGYEWGQVYGDTAVKKHQEHDQKTHGSWATGTPQGSNGLSHREIYHLMAGSSDSKKPAVYRAEEKHQPAIQRKLEKPFPPSREKYLTGEMSKEEYDKAWKEYDKKFDEWSRETSRNIQSELGEQHLDGTRAGVQRFIDDVTKADWFVEAFGNGGVVRTPKVALRDNQAAGTYTIGTKNGVGYSAMVINKGFSLNEPTILHEIAHYATAVSARATYDPHGVEFAKNHIYIASKVIGAEYAAGLEKAYREEGIDLG